MVFRLHRIFSRLMIAYLLFLWLGTGSLVPVTQMTPGNQYTAEGQQHDLNQKAIVKLARNEKRDTLRRHTFASTFVTMHPSRKSLSLTEPLTVDPSGQTTHSPPWRPLHQQISIYRL